MPGAKYRPISLGGATQYYNVLFLKKELDKLKHYADEKNITSAEVVRLAVSNFLEENLNK